MKCSSSTVDTSGKTLEVLVSSRSCKLSRKARSKLVSSGVSQALFTGMTQGCVPVESKILEATELRGVVPSGRSSFGSSGNTGCVERRGVKPVALHTPLLWSSGWWLAAGWPCTHLPSSKTGGKYLSGAPYGRRTHCRMPPGKADLRRAVLTPRAHKSQSRVVARDRRRRRPLAPADEAQVGV